MCGREPNFELPEEEKRELRKFKWEEFLAMTRQAITSKSIFFSPTILHLFQDLIFLNFHSFSLQNILEHKGRHSPGPRNRIEEPSLHIGDSKSKQVANGFSGSGDAEQETAISGNT